VPGHVEERGLGIDRGNARERPDFRVADLSLPKRVVDQRQRLQRARDAHLLSRGTEIEADPPAQPVRAGAGALVGPHAGVVESRDEREEAMGRSVEVGGELRDLVGESISVGVH
jgi:hypothetical protein